MPTTIYVDLKIQIDLKFSLLSDKSCIKSSTSAPKKIYKNNQILSNQIHINIRIKRLNILPQLCSLSVYMDTFMDAVVYNIIANHITAVTNNVPKVYSTQMRYKLYN